MLGEQQEIRRVDPQSDERRGVGHQIRCGTFGADVHPAEVAFEIDVRHVDLIRLGDSLELNRDADGQTVVQGRCAIEMNLAFLTDVVRMKVEARIVEFPRRMSGTEIFGIPSKTNECTPSPVLRHGAEHRTLPRKKCGGLRGICGPYLTGPPWNPVRRGGNVTDNTGDVGAVPPQL